MAYSGNVDLINGLRPKNSGTFPLVNAKDVYVDDATRLDAKLQQLGSSGNFAPAYSASATYAVGDYVMYNGQLYQCKTVIETAEDWTASHWTAVSVGGEISDLKSVIGQDRPVLPLSEVFGWTIGTINSANGNSQTSDKAIRSTSAFYSKGTVIHISDTINYKFNIFKYYSNSFQGVVKSFNDTADEYTIAESAVYRLCIKKASGAVIDESEVTDISAIISYTKLMPEWDKEIGGLSSNSESFVKFDFARGGLYSSSGGFNSASVYAMTVTPIPKWAGMIKAPSGIEFNLLAWDEADGTYAGTWTGSNWVITSTYYRYDEITITPEMKDGKVIRLQAHKKSDESFTQEEIDALVFTVNSDMMEMQTKIADLSQSVESIPSGVDIAKAVDLSNAQTINKDALELLISILQNAIYVSDQAENIRELERVLHAPGELLIERLNSRYNNGGTAIINNTGTCVTIIYPVTIDKIPVVTYLKTGDSTPSYLMMPVFDSDGNTLICYNLSNSGRHDAEWQYKATSEPTVAGIAWTLDQAKYKESYAYELNSGKIIFAGENSKYAGMTNINQYEEVP